MRQPSKLYLAALLLIALVSLGVWLLQPDKFGSQSSLPEKPRSLAEAADVRLFIEGLPHREPPSTQKLINNVNGISLTEDQRTILEQAIRKRRATYEDIYGQPACFIPHHFFRFYDSDGAVFATLAVCYCCGGARLEGPAAARIMGEADFIDFDYFAVKGMLRRMSVPTDIDCHNNARY